MIAEQLRAQAALTEVLSLNSQHRHGGSGQSIKGSDALLWSAGILADRALIYQNNIKAVNLKTRLSVLKTNVYERLGGASHK